MTNQTHQGAGCGFKIIRVDGVLFTADRRPFFPSEPIRVATRDARQRVLEALDDGRYELVVHDRVLEIVPRPPGPTPKRPGLITRIWRALSRRGR